MKKGVNILAIIAIALALIVAAVVLVLFLKKPTPVDNMGDGQVLQQDILGYSALHLESVEQFSEFAKSGGYECHLGNDNSGGSIYNVPVLGQDAVITYYFDAQGNTTDFEAFYYLNADIVDPDTIQANDITQEGLAELCRETVGRFCLMFGFNSMPDVYLVNQDGTFTLVEETSDFQTLVDGASYLEFSIRDTDGYFWELEIYAGEGLVCANVRKYFNVAETKDYIANISLYEEE